MISENVSYPTKLSTNWFCATFAKSWACPFLIFSQCTSTKLSRSGRWCSCKKPSAWKNSWSDLPRVWQPDPRLFLVKNGSSSVWKTNFFIVNAFSFLCKVNVKRAALHRLRKKRCQGLRDWRQLVQKCVRLTLLCKHDISAYHLARTNKIRRGNFFRWIFYRFLNWAISPYQFFLKWILR